MTVLERMGSLVIDQESENVGKTLDRPEGGTDTTSEQDERSITRSCQLADEIIEALYTAGTIPDNS